MAATTPRPVLSGPLRAAVAHLTASALQELRARVADEVAAAVAADAGREHLRRLGHLVRAIDERLVAADDDPPTLERRLAIAAERDRLKAAGG